MKPNTVFFTVFYQYFLVIYLWKKEGTPSGLYHKAKHESSYRVYSLPTTLQMSIHKSLMCIPVSAFESPFK